MISGGGGLGDEWGLGDIGLKEGLKKRFGGNVTNRILAYQIVAMIQKRETCLYCGQKMESKTAKKKFCTPLHRVYYNRELNRGAIAEVSVPYPVTTKTAAALHNAESADQLTAMHLLAKSQIEALRKPPEVNADIQKRIDEIRAEKIPKERDTPFGRKSWQIDQQRRIQELKNQLK